ncbi:nucleotidyltransferase domain-containing protein [Candidatus Pacearchaeota archaeon]|nr:nucleotidyltransferase domain-containing protein [Candidatus Pacearchaeota archaeon]
MKITKSKQLVAYASAFVSFVLQKIDIEDIILFGSVARGEATEKSDIDIFFNVKRNEKEVKGIIKEELEKFYKSLIYETWTLKGIKNNISVEVGDLNKWKLKRSIISDGIVLYGKFKNLPEKTHGFTLFILRPIKNITKRNKIMRYLFGREEKEYKTEGIVKIFGGEKISTTTFLLPLEKTKEIEKILNKDKLDYSFFELWTDAF